LNDYTSLRKERDRERNKIMSGTSGKQRSSSAQRREAICFNNPDDRRDSRCKTHTDIHLDDNWRVKILYKQGGSWTVSCSSKKQAKQLILHSIEKAGNRSSGIISILLIGYDSCDGFVTIKEYMTKKVP
jgi:hypothetical protein